MNSYISYSVFVLVFFFLCFLVSLSHPPSDLTSFTFCFATDSWYYVSGRTLKKNHFRSCRPPSTIYSRSDSSRPSSTEVSLSSPQNPQNTLNLTPSLQVTKLTILVAIFPGSYDAWRTCVSVNASSKQTHQKIMIHTVTTDHLI